MTEEQSKPDLAGLIADIVREECRKLYEKRLAGLKMESCYLALGTSGSQRLDMLL